MGPLDDVRVLDLSQGVAGPFATRFLVGFGAAVVKIEQPGGEPGRRLAPCTHAEDGNEYSPFFVYLNAGKRSIVVDSALPRGRELVCQLAAGADVIVTSFDGGTPAMGIDASELAAANPGAVTVTVSPNGADGPWAAHASNDLIAAAQSGWAGITGEPGKPPLKGPGYQASLQGGLAALMTILGGLLQRDRDGEGLVADAATLDALLVTFAPALIQSQFNGRDNMRRFAGFPVGPVRAKDGYFVLTTSRAHFWRDAMNELGLYALAEDERFNDPAARQELYMEVAPLVEARIGERGRAELFHNLGVLRVPSGMVLDVDELFEDEQLRARGFFETPAPGHMPSFDMPGIPFDMSATPWQTPAGAPAVGEHTDAILREAGIDVDAIAGLRAEGVVA